LKRGIKDEDYTIRRAMMLRLRDDEIVIGYSNRILLRTKLIEK
jgi:hypothetical protein